VSIGTVAKPKKGAYRLDLKAEFVPAGPCAGYVVLRRTVAAPDDRTVNLVAQGTSLRNCEICISGHHSMRTGELEVPQMGNCYVLWTSDE
jgi:hypothetical protein